MKYGIVHYGNAAYYTPSAAHSACKIATELPDGQTISLWKNYLREYGSDVDAAEPTAADLFQFVKSAFEKQRETLLDIEFSKMYIASTDGVTPIPFNEAARLASDKNMIYVDELILSSLFEYVAVYYLWAKDYADENVFAFCFKYTAALLNNTCRLGLLTDDEHEAELVSQLAVHCDMRAANLIADLYWSCLAFAFCHEIAHIYIGHMQQEKESRDALWQREYEADAVGYDVYLKIIETVQDSSEDIFAGVFHDYLYIAPMILLQFYEDAYFMDFWLFGERTGYSHPPIRARFDALLEISEQPQYTFDTEEGNILLNNYMDVSDWFREQLIIKLQKGKLHPLIQKGVAYMSSSGYLDALRFQQNLSDDLRTEADSFGINIDQMTGLLDTAVDIELLNEPAENAFIWSYKGKTYSTKAFNVRFSLHKVLVSILEFGVSPEYPDTQLKAVLAALLILYKLINISTKELSEEHAAVLIECHKQHADVNPIDEEQLLQATGASRAIVTELSRIGCIELSNGTVRLLEEIYIQ